MKSAPVKFFIALLAGAINVAAFAPLAWWFLSLISIAALFALWLGCDRKTAAALGFGYGLGLFGVGTSWMYISIQTYGGMPPLLAGFCILVLVAAMALWFAVAGFIQSIFTSRSNAARLILIMPGVWILLEWLRGWVLSGYPWLSGGYALLDTPLAGLAPLGGVYLVGLIATMSAGALLSLLLDFSRINVALSLLVAAAWGVGWSLSDAVWSRANGDAISVAIVQNNVPLMLKWDAAESNAIVNNYLDTSATLDADLIVWPEAAVPDYLDRMPRSFYKKLREHPADFIFGVLTRKNVADNKQHFNSIAAVTETETNLYNKQHLVPFGEFLPMKFLFAPLVNMMQIPMANFTAWNESQPPLHAAGTTFAASVCYEDAFPNEWRAQVPSSGVLINLSEDIWFGDSLAPHQRLQMARFRSLESARPMIRSSNNGLSSVINWRGEVVTIAPQFVAAIVTAEVQPRTGATWFTVHGDRPALLLALALWVTGLLFAARRVR